jgi:Bacterial regulatory proteins, tetR family
MSIVLQDVAAMPRSTSLTYAMEWAFSLVGGHSKVPLPCGPRSWQVRRDRHTVAAIRVVLVTGGFILRPVRLTRAQQQAATRERLLASAEQVIARQGFGGASIDLIALEAGFSKGAIYSNFESKEEVFLELLRVYMERYGIAGRLAQTCA